MHNIVAEEPGIAVSLLLPDGDDLLGHSCRLQCRLDVIAECTRTACWIPLSLLCAWPCADRLSIRFAIVPRHNSPGRLLGRRAPRHFLVRED
jgi:hypothetical protein